MVVQDRPLSVALNYDCVFLGVWSESFVCIALGKVISKSSRVSCIVIMMAPLTEICSFFEARVISGRNGSSHVLGHFSLIDSTFRTVKSHRVCDVRGGSGEISMYVQPVVLQ